ncbi:hypothetical protein [Caballeronia sp. ATUFL_F1_KS39]|uniref:hypothetical protein n=1 Tax=Caballeronia sp. ATUFL_F1_KS39 TaxID=2921766 RepID=UPI00202895E9|nr:hypothetical protein [Caballeronia sp. ATUFL_F1_KS39]
MSNGITPAIGATLEAAHRQIMQEFPQANPVAVEAFVKAQFHQANATQSVLRSDVIVSNYRRATAQ